MDKLISKAAANVRIAFRPCIFTGEEFPRCAIEPSDAASTLGKCKITTTFYDADYREIKTAARPGRYGAILDVKPTVGPSFKRFLTLYRTPGEIDWSLAKTPLDPTEVTQLLGFDPEVATGRTGTIGDFLRAKLSEGMHQSDAAAVLFAGLSESKPGVPSSVGPTAATLNWWYGLKKQTGNLRTDYFLHLPASYAAEPEKKWPLILFLHGSGERGYDLSAVTNTGLPHDLDARPDFPFIVVAPQCSPDRWWSPFELIDLLDGVEKKYHVDTTRLYLTGLSMGGFGSWALATRAPGRFAAVVPICGGGHPDNVAPLKKTPIWVFHGAKDAVISVQRGQEMVDALKKIGGNVKFTVFPEAGHDSWNEAYAMPDLYTWLLTQRK